ncbi:Hypothetical predicted protein [Paramuricea clavata]|uniref:DUF5641 domain-containing protein n=1 Tax=Paramuricea clavata TaxID=317549 RepID=A0A7D9KYX4_PARCT|nr:Hypothetical predicted protein [Paramuricea clavata]
MALGPSYCGSRMEKVAKGVCSEHSRATEVNTQIRNVKIGYLVLVVDKDTERGAWLLGPATKPIVGDLGVVRAAEVQTKNGILVRPVENLRFSKKPLMFKVVYVLETENEYGAGNVPSGRV